MEKSENLTHSWQKTKVKQKRLTVALRQSYNSFGMIRSYFLYFVLFSVVLPFCAIIITLPLFLLISEESLIAYIKISFSIFLALFFIFIIVYNVVQKVKENKGFSPPISYYYPFWFKFLYRSVYFIFSGTVLFALLFKEGELTIKIAWLGFGILFIYQWAYSLIHRRFHHYYYQNATMEFTYSINMLSKVFFYVRDLVFAVAGVFPALLFTTLSQEEYDHYKIDKTLITVLAISALGINVLLYHIAFFSNKRLGVGERNFLLKKQHIIK